MLFWNCKRKKQRNDGDYEEELSDSSKGIINKSKKQIEKALSRVFY
jgi:hypothetical protein